MYYYIDMFDEHHNFDDSVAAVEAAKQYAIKHHMGINVYRQEIVNERIVGKLVVYVYVDGSLHMAK